MVHGTLAHSELPCLLAFNDAKSHLFLGRHFVSRPTSNQDISTADSRAARVGYGPFEPGPIADIAIKDDAVYATVLQPYPGHEAGVYHSQAIFGYEGKIACWTAWKKIDGGATDIQEYFVDRRTGNHLMVASHDKSAHVERATWQSYGFNGLIEKVNEKLLDSDGIQDMCVQKLPWVIVSSNRLLVAADNEIIKEKSMGQIAPLTTCTRLGQTIFVGGVHGLAAVTPNATESKIIGSYSMVRKLIADGDFLYVLTDDYLDRLRFDSVSNNFTCVRLACAYDVTKQTQSIFYDAIISDTFALLAHNKGMSRVGDGKDIRADDQHSLNWTSVPIPDGFQVATALIPVTVTGRPEDFARYPGQVYVITANIAYQQSSLHRFVVNSNIILPVEDYVTPNHIGKLVSLGAYSSLFSTNGTLFFTAVNGDATQAATLYSGFRNSKTTVPLSLKQAKHITSIKQTENGTWLIGGDFGLRIND